MEKINWDEFFKLMLGTNNLTVALAGLCFAMCGGLLSVLVRATDKKIAENPNSPKSFSLAYIWYDKGERLLSSILVTIILLRFSAYFIPAEYVMFGAVGIGFVNYQALNVLLSKIKQLIPGLKDVINVPEKD